MTPFPSPVPDPGNGRNTVFRLIWYALSLATAMVITFSLIWANSTTTKIETNTKGISTLDTKVAVEDQQFIYMQKQLNSIEGKVDRLLVQKER